ncbi:sugar transferase [Psychroflexus sp. CAK1W]|uniref:sugar transferase n=1 Tax=Psychroflexus curvus TaxID=2873595 RepID=UPI001CCC5669|nr:sugar transferase [Psychroflexus curvus]MBZ9629087.1 sugar transferase [Psychroflexus curvus]
MYKVIFKRIFDLVVSLIFFLLISPLLVLVILLILLFEKETPFFFQYRLGKHGKKFKLYKFRTMLNKKRDVTREILSGDSEVTTIGSYLRRYKIDELPQIINVIKGDMSIVGPRPCMVNQLVDFNEDGKQRLKVKPGLTGLAQINGNIYLSWEERWKYDREYVENLSFLLDLKIFFKTILIVVYGEDKFINKPNV